MITVVSSEPRDRSAVCMLCEAHDLPTKSFETLRAFRRSLDESSPRVVITRHRLADGYSDDVLSALRENAVHSVKIIVLFPPGSSSPEEARQLDLGADCVLRDPIRSDVLVAYASKFHSGSLAHTRRSFSPRKRLRFAGADFDPLLRTLKIGNRSVQLTPREALLARVLIERDGAAVSYEELYESVLGRRFRGDTSNMRVLLGKLAGSGTKVGLVVRDWVQVIPKTGYRYAPNAVPTESRPDVHRRG